MHAPDAKPAISPDPHDSRTRRWPQVLRAATPCTSIAQFVASFAPFVDESSILIASRVPLPVGTERGFVFQLADGATVLQGRGRVMEPLPGDDRLAARLGDRPATRLSFVDLTQPNRVVHRALLEAQRGAPAHPHPNTVRRGQRRSSQPSPPGHEPTPAPQPGAWEEEPTTPAAPDQVAALIGAAAYPRPAADAEPSDSPSTLPANPLAEIPDDALSSFVDYTLHEESGTFPLDEILASPYRAEVPREAAPPRRRARLSTAAISLIAALAGLGGGYGLWGRPGLAAPAIPVSAPAPAAPIAPAPDFAGALEAARPSPAPVATEVTAPTPPSTRERPADRPKARRHRAR